MMSSRRCSTPSWRSPLAWSRAKTSGISVTAMRGQCLESKPIIPYLVSGDACGNAGRPGRRVSGLHKLHLRAGQLEQVAVLEGHRLRADGRSVERGFVRAFDMRHDETVGTLGDRGHGDAGLADGRHDLDQRY